MKRVGRIFEVFVGLVLFIVGAGIIYTFHTLNRHTGHDIWDASFLLVAEAYSVIGSLFILLGLGYVLGPRSFIERWTSRSLRHLAVVVVLLSVAILAAMIFSLR